MAAGCYRLNIEKNKQTSIQLEMYIKQEQDHLVKSLVFPGTYITILLHVTSVVIAVEVEKSTGR